MTYFNCRNESFVQFHPSIKDQHCQITDFTLSTDSSLWACDKRSLLKLKTILKREKKDIQIQYIHTFPLEDSERFMKLCLSENRKALYLVTNHGRIFQFDTNSKKNCELRAAPILKAEFAHPLCLTKTEKLDKLHGIRDFHLRSILTTNRQFSKSAKREDIVTQ